MSDHSGGSSGQHQDGWLVPLQKIHQNAVRTVQGLNLWPQSDPHGSSHDQTHGDSEKNLVNQLHGFFIQNSTRFNDWLRTSLLPHERELEASPDFTHPDFQKVYRELLYLVNVNAELTSRLQALERQHATLTQHLEHTKPSVQHHNPSSETQTHSQDVKSLTESKDAQHHDISTQYGHYPSEWNTNPFQNITAHDLQELWNSYHQPGNNSPLSTMLTKIQGKIEKNHAALVQNDEQWKSITKYLRNLPKARKRLIQQVSKKRSSRAFSLLRGGSPVASSIVPTQDPPDAEAIQTLVHP